MSKTLVEKLEGAIADKASIEAEFLESLEALRERIRTLEADRDEILSTPPVIETALSRVEYWAENLTLRARRSAPAPESFAQSPVDYILPEVDELAALVVYLREPLVQALKHAVTEHYKTLSPVSETDRRKRLRTLEQEILDTGTAEEIIVKQARTAGLPVLRRLNADRRAIAAADVDQPPAKPCVRRAAETAIPTSTREPHGTQRQSRTSVEAAIDISEARSDGRTSLPQARSPLAGGVAPQQEALARDVIGAVAADDTERTADILDQAREHKEKSGKT